MTDTIWERRYIVKQKAVAVEPNTDVTLLSRTGVLSGIIARFAYTNGATGGGGQDIIDAVTKIEVIANGNYPIMSLSGIELAKWAWRWNRRRMAQNRDARAAAVQYAAFPLFFGRWLGDLEYAIDVTSFNTLEVKITYAPTIGATQFATTTGILDLVGIYYKSGLRPPALKGYLRTVQVRNFTGAASGEDITVISQAYKMAGILVYAFQAGIAEAVPVSEINLYLNGRSYIPFSGRWLDVQEQNERDLDMDPLESQVIFLADNATFEARTGRVLGLHMDMIFADVAEAAVPLQRVRSLAGSQVTTAGILAAGSAVSGALDTTARQVLVSARGIGIGHAALLHWVKENDMSLALDTKAYDDVRLGLTMASSGSTIRVSTQEIVTP